MKSNMKTSSWLLLILLLLSPLFILFLLPGSGFVHSGLWFWLVLLLCWWLIWLLLGMPKEKTAQLQKAEEPRMLAVPEQPECKSIAAA